MTNCGLMLGSSGLRGIVGASLTPAVAMRYATSYGQWLLSHIRHQDPRQNHGRHPTVVISRDGRPSGEGLELAICEGLKQVGCRVKRLGILPTPTTSVLVDHLHADGGVIITASHNPKEWNGIKLLDQTGAALAVRYVNDIVKLFDVSKNSRVDMPLNSSVQEDNTLLIPIHINRIIKCVDVGAIQRRQFKVVVDSVNGAGGSTTAQLAHQLGIELVHLYSEPTGNFPHDPEPVIGNVKELCRVVREEHADIGFVQDPDADRLAIVDERGQYIGEEYTLALSVEHVLTGISDRTDPIIIVTNLSTSRMIDDIAQTQLNDSVQVIRTPVGEANVVHAMRRHHALIGGEGNGGVIMQRVCNVRDSFSTMAMVLEMVARRGKTLSNIVEVIPSYSLVKKKIALPYGAAPMVQKMLVSTIKNCFTDQLIDCQDGIRIDWPDRWVHVRLSNTEPALRIVAEANNHPIALELISKIENIVSLEHH